MTRPMVRLYAKDNVTVIDREMNDVEFAQYQTDQLEDATAETARLAEEQTFLTDRANGLAKLEAAGLTPGQARAVARKDR